MVVVLVGCRVVVVGAGVSLGVAVSVLVWSRVWLLSGPGGWVRSTPRAALCGGVVVVSLGAGGSWAVVCGCGPTVGVEAVVAGKCGGVAGAAQVLVVAAVLVRAWPRR